MQTKTLILLLVVVSLFTINPRINGWNEASRMALTQSAVEQGRLSIDKSDFINTGDKVFIDGHFYSDKPVTPSLLAAIFYYPLHKLGIDLAYGWNLAYYLIILLVIKSLWVLSILAFHRLMGELGSSDPWRWMSTLIVAFASQTFTWSATFNNHSIAASCLMLGLAFYVFGLKGERASDLLISGFAFGLAAASDLPTGLFLLGFTWLILRSKLAGVQKIQFIIAGLIPLGIHAGMNLLISGSVLPFQFNPEFMQYPGSPWEEGMVTNSFGSAFKNVFLSLLGPRGFIWYNPLILLLFPPTLRSLKSGSRWSPETRVMTVCSILLFLVYAVLTQNLGGWGYGMRWFIPLLPFFYFFMGELEPMTTSSRGRMILGVLVAYSLVIALIGMINPWSNADVHPIPVVANLIQLSSFIF